MYDSILVPTDGSRGAWRGVDRALELASETGATVHALFVVDERIHGVTPALGSDELYLESVEQEAESFLDRAVERARDRGLNATRACRRGDPCRVILEYAREHRIGLIVMGHHGIAPERPPHLGGCVDAVTEIADVPVIAV